MNTLKMTGKLFILFLVSGSIVSAQNVAWLNSVATGITGLVPTLVALCGGIALLYFVWGAVLFVSTSGNDQSRAEGRSKMLWGVITLFVFVSVWGLVVLVQTLGGVDGGTTPDAPQTNY